ncbi:HAD family hydrolase [Thermocladium modestius]|uniref:HAD family hydrolase n=1 Tax=Thermocladium modestius TaxID=62609 RepID=UPI001667BDB3|nr:HAD-IA family hydrolase [Thermocladium modestius]
MQVKAVLFDFDDTLMYVADGRRRAREAVATAVASLHGVSAEEALAMLEYIEGRMEARRSFDRRAWFLDLLDRLGLREERRGEVLGLVKMYWDSWIRYSKPFPDAEQVIKSLRPSHRLGIVANTDGIPGFKMSRMESSGLLHYFDVVVVAGDDTEETKPDTAPFLLAAQLLGVEVENCMYVGDRASDVLGAVAAGMNAVLVGGEDFISLPHIRIETLLELIDELTPASPGPSTTREPRR